MQGIQGPKPSPVNHHYRNTKETNVWAEHHARVLTLRRYTSLVVMALPWSIALSLCTLDFAMYDIGNSTAGSHHFQVQMTNFPGTPNFETLEAHFIHTDYGWIK